MSTRDIVTAYLRAIESHDLDAVASFLHDDVELVEHPNKISPNGKRANKAEMRAAGERGAALLASERYDVRQMIVDGDRCAVLTVWTGTLVDGRAMTAQICSVIEIKDGKVYRQEQYDCFH
jgi:ketosteroid isomerase-like protein